jgi:hypothetical protein
MALTKESIRGGFALFDGPFKVAIVNTLQDSPEREYDQITDHTGQPKMLQKMPKEVGLQRPHWRIHFCSPQQSIEQLQAVLDAIPKEEAAEQK